MNPVSAAFTSALELRLKGRSNRYNGGPCCKVTSSTLPHAHVVTRKLVSVRTREGPARSWRARGGSTLSISLVCVRSEVTALHVCRVVSSVDSFPSAVLTSLRITEGMYGTREVRPIPAGPRFERTLGQRASVTFVACNETEEPFSFWRQISAAVSGRWCRHERGPNNPLGIGPSEPPPQPLRAPPQP